MYIYETLRRHKKNMGGLGGGGKEEGKNKERRLAVIFAGFVLTFLICHTPREVYSPMRHDLDMCHCVA